MSVLTVTARLAVPPVVRSRFEHTYVVTYAVRALLLTIYTYLLTDLLRASFGSGPLMVAVRSIPGILVDSNHSRDDPHMNLAKRACLDHIAPHLASE